uniref:3'-5' exonuclease n=1 Tax=Promicromonospora sp. CA-289581 TaxID=3240013 RepID=UPI003F490C9E
MTTTDPAPADPVDVGPVRADMARVRAGLAEWQWWAALRFDLIPRPVDGMLSAEQAAELVARADEITTHVGTDRPIGARRAAERLAARDDVDADVTLDDVEALAAAGDLLAVDEYKGWNLYACGQLDALPAERIADVVGQRLAWIDAGISLHYAAERLGWKVQELQAVIDDRGMVVRFDALAATDVDALAADDELRDDVLAARLVTADAAAEHMEIRRADFDHLVRLGMLYPARTHTKTVGRRRTVDVPLYRTRDLDGALRDAPVDWEEIRSTKPGKPSPLARLGEPEPSRATAVRKALADLATRYGHGTVATYNPYSDTWEVDFERGAGAPSEAEFRAALKAHPAMTKHAGDIVVGTPTTAATIWARAMREPRRAVVLDTETTDLDGYVVEIAVLDASTGEVLLDSLVQPDAEISAGAAGVHKITAAKLEDAPCLADLWEQVLDVTRGRTVIAYNAPFDEAVLRRHALRDGLDLAHLGDPETWDCLMDARSDWLRTWSSLPLNGGHRAAEDCAAAVELLTELTNPAR